MSAKPYAICRVQALQRGIRKVLAAASEGSPGPVSAISSPGHLRARASAAAVAPDRAVALRNRVLGERGPPHGVIDKAVFVHV